LGQKGKERGLFEKTSGEASASRSGSAMAAKRRVNRGQVELSAEDVGNLEKNTGSLEGRTTRRGQVSWLRPFP